VDRTTVEKCNVAQAAYGGPARDPFTGTPYSQRIKPVFNAALKSRIDRFLIGKFVQKIRFPDDASPNEVSLVP
jgi:hypothetical protein